jgi:hypothetical protein
VVRKSLGPTTVTEGGQLAVAYTHRLTVTENHQQVWLDTPPP